MYSSSMFFSDIKNDKSIKNLFANGWSYPTTQINGLEITKEMQIKNIDLGEIGLLYEKSQSGLKSSALINKMKDLINTIEDSIKIGLKGTNYDDRILPQQSHLINIANKKTYSQRKNNKK